MVLNETNTTFGNFSISANNLLEPSPLINHILIALLIIFLGLVLGRVAGRLVQRIFMDFQVDNTVKQKTNIKMPFQKFVSGATEYTIYVLFFIWALNVIGITNLLLNIISIVLALLILSTIIFSLRDALPNMVAYRTIIKKKLIKIGDEVEFKNVKGRINSINVSEVVVKTSKGDLIHIPNILFIEEPFIQKRRTAHETNHQLSKFSKKISDSKENNF